MSYEIAVKSIDRFLEYLNKRPADMVGQTQTLSFYGGEPLLEFELIKAVVSYCKKINFIHRFGITTNGTLLDETKIKYLVDNNFMISISLDGPKENHDRNRHFANGKGSYELIYNNILKLKDKINYEGKELTNPIMILSTLDDETDLIKMNDYFCANRNCLGTLGKTTRKSQTGDTCKPFVFSTFNNSIRMLIALYIAKRINHSENSNDDTDLFFLERLLGSALTNVSMRYVSPYGNKATDLFGGSCMPGSKISVSVDGTFHTCEKMNEYFPLGDYKIGLDEQLIENILKEWSSVFLYHCRNCALKGICGPCKATCTNIDRFEMDNHCNDRKPSLPNHLRLLYNLNENTQDSWGNFMSNLTKEDIFNFSA